jgi:hypothetical protein
MSRIILVNDGSSFDQLHAAKAALSWWGTHGSKPGDLFGVLINGKAYGVMQNLGSVRVYPQQAKDAQAVAKEGGDA